MTVKQLDRCHVLFSRSATQSHNAHLWESHHEFAGQWTHALSVQRHGGIAAPLSSPIVGVRLTMKLKTLLRVQSDVEVALFAKSGEHTQINHPGDAATVLSALPLDHDSLRYYGRRVGNNHAPSQRKCLIFSLYFCFARGGYLFVALKYLPASHRGPDEWWVRTAFRINDKEMARRMNSENLVFCFGATRQVGNLFMVADDDEVSARPIGPSK